MNRRLPYEKIIAEKMQHLQLPGREILWQQMKAKLDREMPLPEKGERGGGGKWWWLGSIIIIISAGIWMVTNTMDQSVASGNMENTELTSPEPANTIDYNSTSQRTVNTTDKNNIHETPGDNKNITPSDIKEKTAGAVSNNDKTVLNTNQKRSVVLNKNDHPFAAASHKHTLKNKAGIDAGSKQDSGLGRIAQLNTLSAVKSNPQKISAVADHKIESGNGSAEVILNNNETNIAEGLSAGTGYASVNTENSGYSSHKNITESAGSNKTGTLIVPAYVSTLPDVSTQRKALLREMKRRERKEEKELVKSYRTYHSFWGETTDRWFAAGIAPYQNIAIASQQTYNYNSAAGKNIITDYIPSPYLQLHVTNRIYLLGEFQFNTPQATPSLLLSHKAFTVPSGNAGYTENIYLRKLYYFNMPVSFYYSPVRNFYIGSGLQFSSFNSGLADIEQRSSNNNTLLRSETIKLKDDSLSSKINGSEWRYLFDANYYYDRFMFGFRYNQALNNFVDLRINNILPPTQARNQAFQFYIRYNLVVSDRKK